MSQLVDLICSPPTSTNATPALASFPTLIPSPSAPISSHTPSSAPLATGGNALRIRPHVDIPTSLLVKQQDAMSTPTLSAASQTLSPDASIPLAADLTMTPIEALIALGQAEGDTEHRGSVDQMMLPDAALAAGGDDEAAESASQVHEAARPAVLRTRISISEASPSGTFSPPGISPTDLTGPSSANASSTSGPPRLPLIVASTIDSLPIPILALPATSTADRVRPLILARASHSDAITSTTTYNCAQNGFGASLDVTLGSPTVEFGRRTSLTFKDAIGRRMGRGSCPTPPLANREQASGAQHGSTPYNTPDRYPAVGISRDAQPASPVPTANGQGVHRRPSWKIVLPPLPALSAVSAGMERLAVSQDSTDGSEDCRLLTDDSVRSHGAMSLGLDLDENAARRIVYNRTPYPLSEEEENHDPFSAFAGAAHVVPPKSAQQPDRKRNVGPKRVDLSALHPSDRQHGPDSDAKVGGDSDVDYDSEDEDGDVYSASTAGVRTSLLGSSAAGCGPAKVSSTRDEDDIEFIDPFSGSRISVKEANSQILSDAVRLRPGNPVLVRKSSLGALGGSAVSGAISASRDKFNLDGRHGEQASERGEMDGTATGKYGAVNVSGLPGSTSRSSRMAAFFSRSRTPSTTAMSVNTAPSLHSYPPPTGSAPRVVSKTGASRAGIVQGKNCTQHAAEPVVADGESWGSTGMGKQWSNDSQSAMEGDGLLV